MSTSQSQEYRIVGVREGLERMEEAGVVRTQCYVDKLLGTCLDDCVKAQSSIAHAFRGGGGQQGSLMSAIDRAGMGAARCAVCAQWA